ncbi:lysine biosynthesis protein LysW [Candidatus Peregrinibacteria bacterium]|nr:lysine biosynthesis protein LysW [Candidatus Peregrinibacteria bacterium]
MSTFQSNCTECGTVIALADDVQIGEIINCEECGGELEVMDIDEDNNVTLEIIPSEEEGGEENWEE